MSGQTLDVRADTQDCLLRQGQTLRFPEHSGFDIEVVAYFLLLEWWHIITVSHYSLLILPAFKGLTFCWEGQTFILKICHRISDKKCTLRFS